MDILDQFASSVGFEKHRASYTNAQLDALRQLIKVTHEEGLDWYTTKMEANTSIRCGRKEDNGDAKRALLLIEPTEADLDIHVGSVHEIDAPTLRGSLNEEFISAFLADGCLKRFAEHYPASTIRVGFMPADYARM